MSQSQNDSQDTSSRNEKRYPVKLVNHRNIYARYLVDVNGAVLRDKLGHRCLNVFREELKDSLTDGSIRLIRNSTTKNICYRYFVTSNKQYDCFLDDIENGSLLQGVKYHVYCDEDVNCTTDEYRQLFVTYNL